MASLINGESMLVADPSSISNMVCSMAETIVQEGWSNFAFVGVVRGGDILAHLIGAELEKCGVAKPAVYSLDITLYRDDLYSGLERPILANSNLPLSVDGMRLVLVDDVLFTGRTIRAALQEIMDYGRPEWIRLAVLVDRGHRELPIQPDIVGTSMKVSRLGKVQVTLHHPIQAEDGIRIDEGHYD